MKIKKYSALLVLILSGFIKISAQPYTGLNELKGFSMNVYYSPGNEERARIIAGRCEKAIEYVRGLVGFSPNVRIFILSPEHWKEYATFPLYGMARCDNDRLVMASDDNDFWRSFIPPMDQLTGDLAEKFKKAYTTSDGTLSTMRFFDLLAVHELGHLFHEQAGLTMQRLWLQELFSNLTLHTYIAEKEPENLPALEALPAMVVASGKNKYKFTALDDFEKKYTDMDPANFGWYQSRLHVAAKDIYNAGGKSTFVKLWKGLKENKEEMTDTQLAEFLNNKVDKEIAKVLADW